MQDSFRLFLEELIVRIGESASLLFHFLFRNVSDIPIYFLYLLVGMVFVLILRIPLLKQIIIVPYIIVRPLFRFLGFVQDKEVWSVVYDAKTKQPLDPAYVTITDMLGNEVASAVTDLDGRFGVVLSRGTYTLTVQKTHYAFPSLILQGKKTDGYGNQLYFGQKIIVTDEERVLALHIPMDPLEEDWNEKEKKKRGLVGYRRKEKQLQEGIFFYVFIGTFVSLMQYRVLGGREIQTFVLIFGLIAIFYIVYFVYRDDALHHSVVLDKDTKQGLAFARVSVFTKEKGFQVARRITSMRGQFVCLLARGEYYLTIEKRNSVGLYEKVYTSPPFRVSEGYIYKKFIV